MKKGFYTVGSLIILLICAFVFVLLPAMVGRGNKNELPPFGKYNGKEIRYEQNSDFAKNVSEIGQLYQRNGYQITSQIHYQIFSYSFTRTVSQMAAQDAVKKSGWVPPVNAVNREMMPYFYDETGKYSSKIYKSTPAARVEAIRAEAEQTLIQNRYSADIYGSGIEKLGDTALYGLKAADNELDFWSDLNSKKRGFNLASFDTSNYPDEEKSSFGKANTQKFLKYDMSVITTSDESTAKTVLKRITNGEITFEDAVSEYSMKIYSTMDGKLYSSYAYQVEKLLSDAGDFATLSLLKTGETSPVIQTNSGFSIFRVDADAEIPNFEDEELLKTINSYLVSYESSVIENYFIGKAKDFIADASLNGFDAACENAGITKSEITPFPLNYGNVTVLDTLNTYSTELYGADTNENFLEKAFSLKINEYSEPIVLGSKIVVLQYTTDGEKDENTAKVAQIDDLNQMSAEDALLHSPKLQNNMDSVYYTYFAQ